MTPEELAAQIEKDIAQKGGAKVPIGIIRQVFSADTQITPMIDPALKEFARSHGWRVQCDDDLPTLRVIFYPA